MIYEELVNLCYSLNIFVRERLVTIKEKIDCCLHMFAGTPQGSVVKVLKVKGINITKQAISKWMIKWQEVLDWINTVPKKPREVIAIDETKIKINGKIAFLWAAIDVKNRELLAIETSWLRNGAHAKWFIQDVLKKCKNKKKVKIITDGAGWYPWACRQISVRHEEVHGKKRNYIERFYKTFKAWAKNFDKNFICKADDLLKVKKKAGLWIGLWYNQLRYHESLGGVPCLS
jgi:transposase-like protein